MQRAITTFVLGLTILTAGCDFEHRESVAAPSPIAPLLLGRWSGPAAGLNAGGSPALPSRESCSNLEWHITAQTANSISGTFTATCEGGAQLKGVASGTLVNDVLNWQANGDATIPTFPACPFHLTGTARLEGETIRIDYEGSWCLGPLKGTERLQKN